MAILAGFLVLVGLVFIWQGVQQLQGKKRFRRNAFSKPMLNQMTEQDELRIMKMYGYMRAGFGVIVILFAGYLYFNASF